MVAKGATIKDGLLQNGISWAGNAQTLNANGRLNRIVPPYIVALIARIKDN